MEHPLALAVLNDSKHYDMRLRNAQSMSQKNYAAYMRGLVIEEARVQRIKFQQKSKQSDIDQATADATESMLIQVSELGPPDGFLPDRLAECNHG